MSLLEKLGNKKKGEKIATPINGVVASITETPDTAFAEKMVGDGVVIVPFDNKVYAPADCEISFVFPTKHAIGIKVKSGLEILIHIGIDTVKLKGEGYQVFVSQGEQVKKGHLLMEFDLDYIREHAISIACPFVVTNLSKEQKVNIIKLGDVKALDDVLEVK